MTLSDLGQTLSNLPAPYLSGARFGALVCRPVCSVDISVPSCSSARMLRALPGPKAVWGLSRLPVGLPGGGSDRRDGGLDPGGPAASASALPARPHPSPAAPLRPRPVPPAQPQGPDLLGWAGRTATYATKATIRVLASGRDLQICAPGSENAGCRRTLQKVLDRSSAGRRGLRADTRRGNFQIVPPHTESAYLRSNLPSAYTAL